MRVFVSDPVCLFFCLFSCLSYGRVYAQDIVVEPNKSYLLADSVHAKFGDVYSEADPLGRKALVQWLGKQAKLDDMDIARPVLFVSQFTVDTLGRVRKIKVLQKGYPKAAKRLTDALELSAGWVPYAMNGMRMETEEQLALVLLPPRNPGGEVRLGATVAPLYPTEGIAGFIAWFDAKVKESDWRSEQAALLKKKLKLKLQFTILTNGKVICACLEGGNPKLEAAINKLLSKSEDWQPGLYFSRLCPYQLNFPIELAAWNERIEGEKINRREPPKKTQLQRELERRYQDRQQQR